MASSWSQARVATKGAAGSGSAEAAGDLAERASDLSAEFGTIDAVTGTLQNVEAALERGDTDTARVRLARLIGGLVNRGNIGEV